MVLGWNQLQSALACLADAMEVLWDLWAIPSGYDKGRNDLHNCVRRCAEMNKRRTLCGKQPLPPDWPLLDSESSPSPALSSSQIEAAWMDGEPEPELEPEPGH